MPENAPSVEPGDTIEVDDDAYSFGTGTLRMEVTRVRPPIRRPDRQVWQEIHGFQLRGSGRHPDERVATVRVDAVRKVPDQRDLI